MRPKEIIELFREAGFKGTIYPDIESAYRALEANGSYVPVKCPYGGNPRYIHPEVCTWHREVGDPECLRQGC